MAIYHLRATMISRSAGRSATAAIAYRSASQIEDQRTGLVYDYRAKSGVEHVEILAPTAAPDWVHDRAALWNAVELAETRKNSQVAREVRVALPCELDADQRAELVRDFCQRQFVDRGMVADIALHAPGRAGDDRNHHAHILLTTREIDAQGFTAKNRDWNAVEVLEGWRAAWAQDCNAAFERHHLEARVDHRTLEAQRIEAQGMSQAARERGDEAEELHQMVRAVALDREPLPQLSAGAWQLKERGQEVAAVRVWHEIKAQAREVARAAQELAGQVRGWLDRAADYAMDRYQQSSGQGLAYAGAGDGPERPQDLAARLRAAWEARQNGQEVHDAPAPEREDSLQGLADRLRAAAAGLDRDAMSKASEALQQSREAEERHKLQEVERLRAEELQLQRERDEHTHRIRGPYHGL